MPRSSRGTAAHAIASFALGAAACASMPVGADQPAGSWMTLLTLQLAAGYDCSIDKLLYWRHSPVGGGIGTQGRVRCADHREYEFSRAREHQKFTIRLCQPALC